MKYKICKKCGKQIPRKLNINGMVRDLGRRSYCIECSPFNNNGRAKIVANKQVCLFCGKSLENRQSLFCSVTCQSEYHYNEYIERWKQGLESGLKGEYQVSDRIKKYLFRKYDNKCSKCGWGEMNPYTHRIPLDVHHKDGDYTNNDEENLDLLCPNCHSLTSNYKSLNPNGRKTRKKYKL